MAERLVYTEQTEVRFLLGPLCKNEVFVFQRRYDPRLAEQILYPLQSNDTEVPIPHDHGEHLKNIFRFNNY